MWARWAVLLAGCIALCGCGPSLKDFAETGMNSSAPKYNTTECLAARQEAIRAADKAVAESVLILGADALAVATLPVAPVVIPSFANQSRGAVHNLRQSCGEESFLPLLENKAREGDANAEAWMGQAYDNGTVVKKDPAQAVYWYKLAAVQGNTDAEINLGAHYAAGNGVAKDDARAIELWQAAARHRIPQAETNLGQFYEDGRGVARDFSKAEQFCRAAAVQGFGDAQFLLGGMYEKGEGVPQSDVVAYRWYILADRNGAKGTDERRTPLMQRLSQNDKNVADRQAQHCLDTLYNECP
ncbi:MAG TPA: tetratricopeptide repeat protein [Rhizomicrobium sp.]|jgi:TPR repeat protein